MLAMCVCLVFLYTVQLCTHVCVFDMHNTTEHQPKGASTSGWGGALHTCQHSDDILVENLPKDCVSS